MLDPKTHDGTRVILNHTQASARRGGSRRKADVTPGLSVVDIGARYTAEQTEFLMAIQRYKEVARRPAPEWHEVLAIATALGYRKVAAVSPMPTLVNEPAQDHECSIRQPVVYVRGVVDGRREGNRCDDCDS